MEKEIWKAIPGYEGHYEVSTNGRVKRLERVVTDVNGRSFPLNEKILIAKKSDCGYLVVPLVKDGKRHCEGVHILVAKAFIPNPSGLPCVNHKDENKANPNVNNLEWCSYSYNNTYGTVLERRKKAREHPVMQEIDGLAESVARIKESLKSKDGSARLHKFVVKINSKGEEIARYKSISEAGKMNGFDRHRFTRTKETNGMIIINGGIYITEEKENEHIPVGHKGSRPDLKGKGAKPVMQYAKDGTFIKEFPSIREAAESIGKYGADLTSCCKGKLKTAYGFIWRYKGDLPPEPFKFKLSRPIEQYSLDGEYITSYNSTADAISALGKGTPTGITNNLTGRAHSAYGYKWKYANDNKNK